jgi:hypothetical protein
MHKFYNANISGDVKCTISTMLNWWRCQLHKFHNVKISGDVNCTNFTMLKLVEMSIAQI